MSSNLRIPYGDSVLDLRQNTDTCLDLRLKLPWDLGVVDSGEAYPLDILGEKPAET